MIKIGLIGAGFMGGTHGFCYDALIGKYDFKVVAVADKDIEKAKSIAVKFGAEVFDSGEELIDKCGINTVDICVPTYLHTSFAVKSMEKGFNAFIEKPVCLTEAEAWQLMDVQKKTGVKVMVGQCLRFWAEYVFLKKLVDEKTYGRVVSGVLKRLSPRPVWAWEGWFMDYRKSGSAALDLHIHDVDYIRYIMGLPDDIKSEITCRDGSNEHIFSLYRYGDTVISIEGGWDFPSNFPFEMEYRVKFEKAAVIFNSSRSPSLKIYMEDGTVAEPVVKNDFSSESEGLQGNISSLGGYYNELKYFLECLENGSNFEISSLSEGIESFRLVRRGVTAAVKK